MSYDDIIRRARRMPSDPPTDVVMRELRTMLRPPLPPGSGTSIMTLPWWRRAIVRARFW
jgi:hypothetical protein